MWAFQSKHLNPYTFDPAILLERICPLEILKCVDTNVGMKRRAFLIDDHGVLGISPKHLLMGGILSSEPSVPWNLTQKE